MLPHRLLSLSDAELETVMACAAPLDRARRDGFLQEVAATLRRYQEVGQEIGPGLVGRVCCELQRRHFDPPIETAGQQPRQLRRFATPRA
jgi:hypothetical protein